MIEEHGVAVALGVDIGTSGVRVAAVDAAGRHVASAAWAFEDMGAARAPSSWWKGVETCFATLRGAVALSSIEGVAIDGTSGTLVALDAKGVPIGEGSLYNDVCHDEGLIEAVDSNAPAESPARGATSPVARAVQLSRRQDAHRVGHQADWIAMRLTGGEAVSDENNALKTGYDLVSETWPDWIQAVGISRELLPRVLRTGTPIAPVGPIGLALGLPESCVVHAGTTDGCASFLATGASAAGDAVTALGSTLVIKIASDRAISAPKYGIYSHRVGPIWLVGGASNTGGAVIKALFGDERLAELTSRLRPEDPTGLDYYPLVKPGERFPVNDPHYPPRLDPRPADDATFFQAVLEGIAGVESRGYWRLRELGAPTVGSLRSVGGGARNHAWTTIRQRMLGVPFVKPLSQEAATGAAMLVLQNRRHHDNAA